MKHTAYIYFFLLLQTLGAQDADYHAQARMLVGEMTLEEKASLTSGLNFWSTKPIMRLGVPSIFMTDGPHGLRKSVGLSLGESVPATCFPTAPLLAATWNPQLVEEVGAALGEECQANDVQILLGPGNNMKRSPLGGRNFEYFSEDPVLAGKMAAALIRGIQGQGVGTSLKHFAVNNQEFERMVNDSQVDERTMREVYLPAFEIAVKEGEPWTVMCSYNKVNGTYASENGLLLQEILRNDWGFQGFVVSDWGAVNNRVAGVKAGLNLEMPSSLGKTDQEIVAAVKQGTLSEARLNEVVAQYVAVALRAYASRKPGTDPKLAAHHKLGRKVGAEGIVLLKNEGGLLPIAATTKRIALVGQFAKLPRYQGAGSSQVNPAFLDNALDELGKLLGSRVELRYVDGYSIEGEASSQQVATATEAARWSDLAIVFAGLPDSYESEGFDRTDINLPPGHNRLIEAIAAVQPHCAVVLMNGSAVAMPWINRVPAVVEGWLGGQSGGGAIADVLTGAANPSGKLSETFPVRLEDTPAYLNFPGLNGVARYGEEMFIGYRYYDARRIAPLFPFGFGLSYTTFAYTKMSVPVKIFKDTDKVTVSLCVKNTGSRAGAEVVQLYIHGVADWGRRPEQALRHFAKVQLAPGEEKTISFELTARDFSIWDEVSHRWAVVSGDYELRAGGSSRDLPMRQLIKVQATQIVYPKLTRESLIKAFAEQPRGKPVYDEIMKVVLSGFTPAAGPDTPPEKKIAMEKTARLMTAVIRDLPVWKCVSISGGAISENRLEQMLAQTNAPQ